MVNILTAIENLVNKPLLKIGASYLGRNRIHNIGEGLEEYIKDLFAGSIDDEKETRLAKINETFSYIGNKNNPPDLILKNGDAIEIKKIESMGSSLALNSSYPKARLYADSPLITTACRTCENWTEKDMWYVVGVVDKSNVLKALCFVCGEDYAASNEIYERIKQSIREGVVNIPDVEFSETNELGRVNKVDPLGITYLRIRGMWGIQNPFCVFREIYTLSAKAMFHFMAIMNEKKYEEMGGISYEKLNIKDVKIKNPDNPAQLKKAKLITFCVEGEEE